MVFNQISGVQTQSMILMFVLWVILLSFSSFLIYRQRLNTKLALVLFLISLVLGGIILGGIPNAILPILQIVSIISQGNPIIGVIPMIVILFLLLLSTLFFGRIFCGYACPLGSFQELASKIQFGNNPKKKKSLIIEIPKKYRVIIRGIFFLAWIFLLVIFSLNLVQLINPFLGFSFFLNPLNFVSWVPLLFFGIIGISSVFIYRPWCTLGCPFGLISNLTARFSRFKLQRNENCTKCELCEKICPIEEAFETSEKSECYLCHRCVEICPINAINFKN